MFIQVIQGMCHDPDMLHRQMDGWRDRLESGAEGFLGGTYGVTDDGEFLGVVRFDSKEAAQRNSIRPEQGQWWAETETCFDGPVTFHDCNDVVMMMGGGSDDAGFVQIMQGQLTDPAKFRDVMNQPMDMLHTARPDIIGGTVAIDDNGFFTQTMAFRTESEAREGEGMDMPAEMREQMSQLDGVMGEVSYHDLHHPWFETAGAR
ncbi:MAG: hypothetical protein L0H79_05380 [Intrasporangium sp.]|uniref:hypothetical protein n=1 Tax=Intrasporangium sp. TaxID=1925024 RepID=UPI0026486A7E|nr:hypothetical protein [Intrasporangium sp.]MDN5795168.1 hypothetical protein [Intrasporangium sp.]